MTSNLFSRGFTGTYNNIPNFYSGYKNTNTNNNNTNTNKQNRPNSAGNKRPSGSGYASNNPQTMFYSDKRNDDPRIVKQGSQGGSSSSGGVNNNTTNNNNHNNNSGGSNRPSSAGTNRASSSDPKKRAIWTTNGIQLQQTEKKETPIPQSPPGYARPKSASMGRSKSQGISTRYGQDETNPSDAQQTQTNHPYLMNQKDRTIPNPVLTQHQQQQQQQQQYNNHHHYQQQQQQQGAAGSAGYQQQYPTRPNVDQYSNSNDRWTSSYRLQYGGNISSGINTPNSGSGSYSNPSTSRPYSGTSNINPNHQPQYYQRNGGKEVILDENISFQGINLSNTQDNSYDSGEMLNNSSRSGGHGSNGNTASSRIRAAINLGNQYNQQVKQKTQVVEDVIAVVKEREVTVNPNGITRTQEQNNPQIQQQQQQLQHHQIIFQKNKNMIKKKMKVKQIYKKMINKKI